MTDQFITDEDGKVIPTCKKSGYLRRGFEPAPLRDETLKSIENWGKNNKKKKMKLAEDYLNDLFRFIFIPPIVEFGDVIKIKGCKKSYHFDFKATPV